MLQGDAVEQAAHLDRHPFAPIVPIQTGSPGRHARDHRSAVPSSWVTSRSSPSRSTVTG